MTAVPELVARALSVAAEVVSTPVSMLTDPSERLFWGYLAVAAVIALSVGPGRGGERIHAGIRRWFGPSSRLDLKLLLTNAAIRAVGALVWTASAFGFALWIVARLDARFGPDGIAGAPAPVVVATYTLVLFVAWDLSRYLLHRLLHEVPALWELHKVHHSAQVLTPLTLYRTHPIESLLYAARGVLVTGALTGLFFHLFRDAAVQLELLGVNVLGFGFNLIGANLRHSHVWWSWGRLERFFISPAQHQLHHAADADRSRNLGTWLSIWDRLGGTLRLAGGAAPGSFGLPSSEANHHPHRLGSALWRPIQAATRRLRRGRAPVRGWVAPLIALFSIVASARAHAAPPSADGEASSESDDEGPGADDPAAHEEDDDYQRTVVVGSMFDQDALPRVAGSAHVIDQRELEEHEYDDVHRVLGSVPGVYVRGEDGFGLRPNIGLRGANPDRSAKVTLMEDGILLGPAPYAAPAAYYFPLSTRMVGVEVFKGPSAIRYGPNTIGGAINMLTRGIPEDHASAIDVALGRFGYGKGHGWWGTTYNGFGVLVEATRIQTSGFKELDGGGDTGFGKNEGMIKLGYRTPPGARIGHLLTLKGGFSTERSNETYLGLSQADFDATPYRRYAASALDQMNWWRSQAELTHIVDEGRLISVETRLYRHDFHRSWYRLDHFANGPSLSAILANPDSGTPALLADVLRGDENADAPSETLVMTDNDRRFASEGIQSVVRWRPVHRGVAQELELGARLHHDWIMRRHTEDGYLMTEGVMISDGLGRVPATRNRGEAIALAFHAHDAITFHDRLTIAPGLRMEVVSLRFRDDLADLNRERTDVAVTPGIGVLFDATPWLDAFAGVHRGFSPVSPGQTYEVEPEYSLNYEAGLRSRVNDLNAEAIGFFSDYTNLNSSCTDSSGCTSSDNGDQFNAGRVFVYGLESRARYRHWFDVGLGLEFGAQYTYTGSSFRTSFESSFPQWGDVEAGDALPYVPAHLVGGNAGIGGRIWSFDARMNYNGAMRDVAGHGDIPDAERIPGFFTLDLAADVRIKERLRIYALVNNATNSAYVASRRPFGIRPGAPLTFMVGVTGYLFGARG